MKERNAVLLLLLTSLLWGMGFVAQSSAADVMGGLTFNGIRMVLGGAVLLPLVIRDFNRNRGDAKYFRTLAIGSLLCGISLTFGSSLQQLGLNYTTAGKAAFITSIYSLLVPVFSMIIGRKVGLRIWLCVAIGLAGAFLLCIDGDSGIGLGDGLIFACAVCFAVQVMLIDHYVRLVDAVAMSAMQFMVVGAICIPVGLATEPFGIHMLKDALVPILYAGVVSSGIAYTLQPIGQRYVSPSKACLALSLESAWGAVGGALLLNESLSGRELFGCILMFSAVVISQLPARAGKVPALDSLD